MKLPSELNQLQKVMIDNMYKSFVKSCLQGIDSPRVVKSNFMQVNSTFSKFGQSDEFCRNTDKLCDDLLKHGNTKIANILLDELGKIYARMGQETKAEEVIQKSLEISRSLNDKIHVLARLTDLEFLYKNINQKSKLIDVLVDKIHCCKDITKNYSVDAANFDTISKRPTDLNGVKVQMAFAYNSIADEIADIDPHNAIECLKRAKNIYFDINSDKEVKYLTKKIGIFNKKLPKSE